MNKDITIFYVDVAAERIRQGFPARICPTAMSQEAHRQSDWGDYHPITNNRAVRLYHDWGGCRPIATNQPSQGQPTSLIPWRESTTSCDTPFAELDTRDRERFTENERLL